MAGLFPLRTRRRGASAPAKFVEIIEADTGKVVRSLNVGSIPRTDEHPCLRWAGPGRAPGASGARRLPSTASSTSIERWSRVTGKVTGTISLPVADSGPQVFGRRSQSGRLVFSADRKSLLSIPAEPGSRSTVWDLAAAKHRCAGEFENDFMAEAFFPDGRRVIGMSGIGHRRPGCRDRRDDQTMADARWPRLGHGEPEEQPASGGVSVPADTRQPDAQSLWVSPDGRWVAAFGQHPMANNALQWYPDAQDDLPLRRRVRAGPRAHPDPRRPGR